MSTGKPMSRRKEWLEFWERREAPFLRVLPYVLLLLCIGFDIATRHGVGSATSRGSRASSRLNLSPTVAPPSAPPSPR
jgi:hypothetical protein